MKKTQRFGNWICFRPQVRKDTYSVGDEKTQRFGNWICFRPQVREDTYSVGDEKTQRFGNWISFRPQVREDTYSVGTMAKVRKPNISVCYTPSSEPYSIYFLWDLQTDNNVH
jgi:cytochrome c-type biogenesis protein CcmH/NrfF